MDFVNLYVDLGYIYIYISILNQHTKYITKHAKYHKYLLTRLILQVDTMWRFHAWHTFLTEFAMDEAIAAWIQDEFEDGAPLYQIGDALPGLHHFEPSAKRKLPKSWRFYSIWRRYEVPCRAPPLTQDFILAMAGWCLEQEERFIGAWIPLPASDRRDLADQAVRLCDPEWSRTGFAP